MIAANPDISVISMARSVVIERIRYDSREFEPLPATTAVRQLGLDPEAFAADLPDGIREQLGRTLEALELRREPKPAPGRAGLVLVGWALLVLAAALVQDAMMRPPRFFYAVSVPTPASYAPLGPKLEAWDAVSIADMH
jgi:hypothetical protein